MKSSAPLFSQDWATEGGAVERRGLGIMRVVEESIDASSDRHSLVSGRVRVRCPVQFGGVRMILAAPIIRCAWAWKLFCTAWLHGLISLARWHYSSTYLDFRRRGTRL